MKPEKDVIEINSDLNPIGLSLTHKKRSEGRHCRGHRAASGNCLGA